MGHSKVVALACGLALAVGCAGLHGTVIKAFRQPGESLAAFPEEVWKEYECAKKRRPHLVIEKNELAPERLNAGGDFNHRFVYALCPAGPTEVIAGRLHTRIRYKGRALISETDPKFELKPGRWIVDAFVEIPDSAEPGVYSYELAFRGGRVNFEKQLTFIVEAP